MKTYNTKKGEKCMSRILIVEDEEAIADLEKDYLELSDFEVKIENTGDAGLATALAEEFDLSPRQMQRKLNKLQDMIFLRL